MSRRELRNLAIDGTEALIDGYRDEQDGLVYYYKGAYYEYDGSSQAAIWAREGDLTKRLPAGHFHLKAIAGERTVHGQLQFLANWAKYDQATWEPATAFRAEDVAAWQTEKARLANVGAADVDDGSESEEDAESNAEDSAIQGALSAIEREDGHNSEGNDDENIRVSPGAAAEEQDFDADHDYQPLLATQKLASSRDRDDDKDDVYAECDDPAGADNAGTHADAKRCRSSKHPTKTVYTCSVCRDKTFTSLEPGQKTAYLSGADTRLCWGCGEVAVDSMNAFPCQCATEDQCGSCLTDAAQRLAEAKASSSGFASEETCADCSHQLQEGERVLRCLACGGLKRLA